MGIFELCTLSQLTLIQESHFRLNFISNSSAFVWKPFRLLYGRDKDSLSEALMFVQSHAQTFLLSSTIFITLHALNVIYGEYAVNFSNQSSESAIMLQ